MGLSTDRLPGLLGGGGLALAAWLAVAGTRPEVDPRGWLLSRAQASVELPELAGELRPSPSALDLWDLRAAAPLDWRFGTGSVDLRATIPDGAELDVLFGATLGHVGAGPQAPNTTRILETPPLHDHGNPGVRVRFDRLRHRTVGTGALVCAAGPEVPEDVRVRIDVDTTTLHVHAGEQELLACTLNAPLVRAAPVFAAGIRRVQLHGVDFRPDGAAPWSVTFGATWRHPVGGAVAALAGALLGALLPRRAGGVLLPGVVAGAAVFARWRGTLDALRLLAVPEAVAPLLIGGVPAVLLGVVVGARGGPRRALVAGLLPAAALLPALALGFPDAPGWVLGALGGLPLALAAEGSRARWPAPVLQALVLSTLPVAELAARHTQLDTTWTVTEGFARARTELDELLVQQQYHAYPSEGFPVRPPDPRPGVRRVVALGGSSTGGAFQMDDLSLFWPKKLEERLSGSGWEVVNQAVGGWNTALIRLYVEGQLDRLAPDVLVLYVGHNDVMTRSPVRYGDYIAQYRAGVATTPSPLVEALRGLRVYNGLKFFVLAARQRGAPVSVPIGDARENLTAIVEAATAHHAKVLLLAEGVNPDPSLMDAYAAMEAEVAEATGAVAFDTNRALFALDSPDLYIDDCHLSISGHEVLAGLVEKALRDGGLLGD